MYFKQDVICSKITYLKHFICHFLLYSNILHFRKILVCMWLLIQNPSCPPNMCLTPLPINRIIAIVSLKQIFFSQVSNYLTELENILCSLEFLYNVFVPLMFRNYNLFTYTMMNFTMWDPNWEPNVRWIKSETIDIPNCPWLHLHWYT